MMQTMESVLAAILQIVNFCAFQVSAEVGPGWVVVTRTDPVEVACKGGADITGLLSLPKFLKSYVGGCFNERLQTTHLNHGRSDAPVAFLLQSPSLIPFVMSRASSAWVALILTQTRMTGFFSGLLMESNNRDAC